MCGCVCASPAARYFDESKQTSKTASIKNLSTCTQTSTTNTFDWIRCSQDGLSIESNHKSSTVGRQKSMANTYRNLPQLCGIVHKHSNISNVSLPMCELALDICCAVVHIVCMLLLLKAPFGQCTVHIHMVDG